MRHPFQLRHHASGFADSDQSRLLPCSAVELEVSRHRADGAHELFRALPTVGLGDDAAVVADHIHRNDTSPASAVKVLAQPRVSALSLLVLVGSDQAVENLSDGERKINLVLVQHATHLIEQLQCCATRCPRCEAAHTCTNPLRTTEQLATSVHHTPRKMMGDEGQPNFPETFAMKSASRCPSHWRKMLHALHVTRFACGPADEPMTPR